MCSQPELEHQVRGGQLPEGLQGSISLPPSFSDKQACGSGVSSLPLMSCSLSTRSSARSKSHGEEVWETGISADWWGFCLPWGEEKLIS